MSAGITLEEMLAWNDQASVYWNAQFDANPILLDLPCGIGGAANVQEFVRHIWGAELRWAQRLAVVPVTAREKIPAGPLDALFDMHRQAVEILRNLLAAPEESWSGPYVLEFDWTRGRASRLPQEDRGARALPQPAPLGATRYAGPQRRVPLKVPRRPAL
jgi:hypothetical protein